MTSAHTAHTTMSARMQPSSHSDWASLSLHVLLTSECTAIAKILHPSLETPALEAALSAEVCSMPSVASPTPNPNQSGLNSSRISRLMVCVWELIPGTLAPKLGCSLAQADVQPRLVQSVWPLRSGYIILKRTMQRVVSSDCLS